MHSVRDREKILFNKVEYMLNRDDICNGLAMRLSIDKCLDTWKQRRVHKKENRTVVKRKILIYRPSGYLLSVIANQGLCVPWR